MSKHYEHTITITVISPIEHLEGKYEDALDVAGLISLLGYEPPTKVRDVTVASLTEDQVTHLLENDYDSDPDEYFDASDDDDFEDDEEEMD